MFGSFDLSDTTYDRFTDRARLALALAEQFAMEQQATSIEPEHILRGVASGGRGVGRTVLEGLGIDLFRLLPEIAELRPHSEIAHSTVVPDVRLGAGSAACLEVGRRRAKELRHEYLGTEHLVMGLIETNSPASAFLRSCGATHQSFRNGVVRLLTGEVT